jgi:arsenate reductase-like glutaredoxin family protein
MPCKNCGAADHAEVDCPKLKSEPDKVDLLIQKMSALLDRPAPAPIVADSDPDPDPAPKPGPTQKEIAEKFKELVNSGKADEAFVYANEHGVAPQLRAMYEPLMATMGQQAIQRLKDKFGEKFAKREHLFKKLQKEYNLSDAALANPKTLDDLWLMTRAKDPTFAKEEEEARMTAAKKEWEDEANRQRVKPASLGPLAPPVREDLKADAERYLLFDPDPTVNAKMRHYLDRQLHAFGVTHEAWLEQRKHEDDPKFVEEVGEGPFKKRVWTRISAPAAPKGAKQ